MPTRHCSGHLRIAPPPFYPSPSPADHHRDLSLWPKIGTTTSLPHALLWWPPPPKHLLGELIIPLRAHRKKNQRERRIVATGSHLRWARSMAPPCRTYSPPPSGLVCHESSASWWTVLVRTPDNLLISLNHSHPSTRVRPRSIYYSTDREQAAWTRSTSPWTNSIGFFIKK
jgi:hypothetical protein